MIKLKSRKKMRQVRHGRIRKKVAGVKDAPRLCVFKSSRHFYAQVINDEQGATLLGVSTLSPDVVKLTKKKKFKKVDVAKEFGKIFAAKALEKGITTVRFDRGGYTFHGRIKAFADAARQGGLKF